MSEKSGTNGNFIYYLLFTLCALYVHPDTLRILSAALPCLCGFAQQIGIDSSTTVYNSLPKVTKISDFNNIHLCFQESSKCKVSTLSSNVNAIFSPLTFNCNLQIKIITIIKILIGSRLFGHSLFHFIGTVSVSVAPNLI
jgi:hypothetical protein